MFNELFIFYPLFQCPLEKFIDCLTLALLYITVPSKLHSGVGYAHTPIVFNNTVIFFTQQVLLFIALRLPYTGNPPVCTQGKCLFIGLCFVYSSIYINIEI